MLQSLARIRHNRRTHRVSSWDKTGRNSDWWIIPPGETRVLADLRGPGQITHIWFAQPKHYREVLLRITWDDAAQPSVLCPVGDFFGLGNGIANSYQSALFSASANSNNQLAYDPATGQSRDAGCALNSYVPMPFRKAARIELVNESGELHAKWFYIDYEMFTDGPDPSLGYLHAEFRRTNPFRGWGGDLPINTAEVDVQNKERFAHANNYVILDTKGTGQYIGCNLSVANICGGWWGEGDDMIWVDGYHWPPDLHGTGSEDYFNQAWGMQPNAYWRNGSSIFEGQTGGYQTSYVYHLENPVYFKKEIKVTIECGHGNHLTNDLSSVAYWYATQPTGVSAPPPVQHRRPVFKNAAGQFVRDPACAYPGPQVTLTKELLAASPAVASALLTRDWKPWKLRQLKPTSSLAAAVKALQSDDARPLAGIDPANSPAELRLARCGDQLALSARVLDAKLTRPINFWEGSSVELYASIPESCEIKQLVFLPSIPKHRSDVQCYCFAKQQPLPAKVTWQTRTIKGGYELTALVPLAALGIKKQTRELLFECAVNLAHARGRGYQRVGLRSGCYSAYSNNNRYGLIKL